MTLLLVTACQLVLRRKSSLPESSELEITRQFVTKRKKVINKGDTWKIRDTEPGLDSVLLGNTALVMSQDCPSHHTLICQFVCPSSAMCQVADSCSESDSCPATDQHQAGDNGAQEYRVQIMGAQGGSCLEQ